MKITVSYINSIYETKKTINLLNETSADAIHMDLMDGTYKGTKNFDINYLNNLVSDNKKALEIHMMVNNPTKYIDKLITLKPTCIYIHPKTEASILKLFHKLDEYGIKKGLAINPDEEITNFNHYYPYIDRILLMSVNPGKGGQKFIDKTEDKLKELIFLKKEYGFKIYVDGGINSDTIKKVRLADGIIAGSFICTHKDFESQIEILLKNSM